MIRIRNIHKTYKLGRTDVPVLRGVDLDVAKGELLVILGGSGSGKSTLLHLLGGLDRPDADVPSTAAASGFVQPSIVVGDVELTTLSPRGLDTYRSRTVGFVFQFYHLLPELTVLENVMLAAMVDKGAPASASAAARRERAMVLLHAVGLDHRLSHRPVELSGGERQRVAIARALINKPPLLLADEPTGNLDSTTGAKVLDTLLALRRDHRQTMVIVTHDAATAARADRVVRLVDGQVVREETPARKTISVGAGAQNTPATLPADARATHNVTEANPPVTNISAPAPLAPGSPLPPPQPLAPQAPSPQGDAALLPLNASQGPQQILQAVRQALQRGE
jgi:lipoprotein-releasing system ATP-binding protein